MKYSTQNVQGMSFDTTASSPDAKEGACTLFEVKTSRDPLWIAYRYYVFETMLSKLFTLCFWPSNSLKVILFKRYKDIWATLPEDH